MLADTSQQYTDRDFGKEVHLWGARERNARYWNQLRSGDVLLFYTESGSIHMQRAYTELNEELGAEVYTRQVVTIMLRAPSRQPYASVPNRY